MQDVLRQARRSPIRALAAPAGIAGVVAGVLQADWVLMAFAFALLTATVYALRLEAYIAEELEVAGEPATD